MTSTPLHPLKQSFEMLVSNLMEPIGQICIVRDGKMLILSVCLVVPAIAKYLPTYLLSPGRFFDGHIFDGHIFDGHIFDQYIK